jgi:hypothetical protein
MKYYVDEQGRALGGWDDWLEPPEGAIEVTHLPEDMRQIWLFAEGRWGGIQQSREEVEQLRLVAYSDPISGSDRYFAEMMMLQATGGQQEEIDAARAKGAVRYAEIQAQYPWPEA